MSQSDSPTADLTRDDIVDERTLRGWMADAYRQCVLAGSDMRTAAEALESVRQARSRLTVVYPTWRELDDQIASCQDATLQVQLIQVRSAYRRQLAEATVAWARGQSFGAWIERLGITLAAWRLTLGQALVTAAPPAPDEVNTQAVALLPRAVRYMFIDAWDQTRSTFEWLAGHGSVRLRDRAFFRARAAQIDLLFGGDIDGALAQLDQAATLTDDVTLRADLECVRGQCYQARAQQVLAGQDRSNPDAAERARVQRALAIASFENSTRLDPTVADPLYYRGDVALDEGDQAGAESWYRHAISAQPGAVSSYVRLFRLLASLKRHDEIPAVVARAVALDEEAAADTLATCSGSYREGGDLAAALEYAELAVRRDPARGKCYYTRGQVLMAQKQWADAIADFRRAVELEPTAYAAKDWRWDFVGEPGAEQVLLEELSRTPHDPIIRQALSGLVARWHGDAARLEAALHILDALQQTGDDSLRAEIANARGDVYYYAGNHAAASAAFNEAWRLDRSRIVHGTNLVAVLREMRACDEAERAVEDVFRESNDEAWRSRELAAIANIRGNDKFGAGDYRGAWAAYEQATALRPDEPVYWSNFALACTNHVESHIDDKGIVALLARAADALGHALRLQPDVADYRHRLARIETLRMGVIRYGAVLLQRMKPPTILRVVVASNLVDLIAPDRGERLVPALLSSIENMRQWLREAYGVEAPAVRFLEEVALANGSYRIEVFDTTTRAGVVSLSLQLLVGSDAIARAAAAGITGTPGASPLNGEPGVWLAARERERAVALGLVPWSVMDFVVYDVAYQVLRRMKELVGHDEALGLLRNKAARRLDPFERDGALLTRLVRVLRGLLAERVSIAAIEEIATLVSESSSGSLSDTELIARARLLAPVRRSLPGHHAGAVRLPLLPKHAEAIRHGIVTHGAEPVLAIAPEAVRELLQDVRELVGRTLGLSALVVDDAAIRPFVRRVLETEFPQLWVLTQAECADQPDARTCDARPSTATAVSPS